MNKKKIGIAFLWLLIAVSVTPLALSSCGNNGENRETADNNKKQQDTLCQQALVCPNISYISFFGKPMMLDDSTHIMQQIEDIAAKDSVLSVEDCVLKIGDVGFGINIHDSELLLISSTPVDDLKIEQVVAYLSDIYGTPEEMEPYHYWWKIKGDYENPGGSVRLRSLRGSEDGGTVILITP